MSVPTAIIMMIVTAGVWVGVMFLSRSYNHGGRDPIDPLYSISQWNPDLWKLTGSCVVPGTPSNCVIEGMTGAYQAATHWCNLTKPGETCIDPDTGASAKSNPVPLQVVCANVPYCGWSKCFLTFDGGDHYVKVTFSTGGGITLDVATSMTGATTFFMERLAVDKGLVNNQNGTIARFYTFPPPSGSSGSMATYILSYSNNIHLTPATTVTQLGVERFDSAQLTMFVLMETMPTSISPYVINKHPALVARKILVFGGANRTRDPDITELSDFNGHVQSKMWANAENYELTVIQYNATNNGFFGSVTEAYTRVLNGWDSNTIYLISQDAVEDRLAGETRGSTGRVFYNWQG